MQTLGVKIPYLQNGQKGWLNSDYLLKKKDKKIVSNWRYLCMAGGVDIPRLAVHEDIIQVLSN